MKDRKIKSVAIFIIALIASISVPHFSISGFSFGTKAAEAQSGNSDCISNGCPGGGTCNIATGQCETGGTGGTTATITFQGTSPVPPQLNAPLALVFNIQDNPNIASVQLLMRFPSGQTFTVPIQWRAFGCPPSCSGTLTPNQAGTYQYDIRALSSTGSIVAGPISGTFSVDTTGTSPSGPYLCITGNSYFCSASSSCNGLGIFHSNRGSVQACSSECSRLASSGAVCTTEQAIRQRQGGIGSTGILSGLACQACQERGGVFCAIPNDYINNYYAYGTSGINPLLAGSLYRTECVRDSNECSLKKGTSYENGATCPDLCQETCYTASLTGGFQLGAGSVQGSNFQSLGLPIASCSAQPPIDIAGIILTGTSNQNVLQRPLLLQGNLCPRQEDRCWCTIIRSSSISGSIGGTSGLGFSSIPGSTRTQHWSPPKFTPPKAGPNEPVCDLASKNITIQAGLEGADGSSIRLVLAGQPVTIKGDIGTRSGVCKGYSYTCLDPQESQCEFKRGFWKDTYKYQACEVRSDFDNLGRIAGKGQGSDWHIGKILTLVAMAVLMVVAMNPGFFSFLGIGGGSVSAGTVVTTSTVSTTATTVSFAAGTATVAVPAGVSVGAAITGAGYSLASTGIITAGTGFTAAASISGAAVAAGIAAGLQFLAPTIDGCDPNSAAILPLARTIGNIGSSLEKNKGGAAKKAGESCRLSGECGTGLICSNSKCTQNRIGGRCEVPGDCPLNSDCVNSVCVATSQTTFDLIARISSTLEPEEIEQLNKLEQRITGQQIGINSIPGCDNNNQRCRDVLLSLFAGANGLRSCPLKEPRECWSVCGFEYKTDVGAQPLCDQGGVVCDYSKSSKSCAKSSATAGTYQCTSRSCGGAPDATVNIRVIAPDGSLIKQDQTRADANGLFSYTLNAPDVDGEVTLIVSTPQQGSVTLSVGG